jgi:hypothetical protein
MSKQYKIPKRISQYNKKPIEIEAYALEAEYMSLLSKERPTEYDKFLIGFLHKRCNKLWNKIARKK